MFEVRNDIHYKVFIDAQTKAIEVSKWLEGERINADPGQQHVLFWVHKNAKNYAQAWQISLCKACKNAHCRYKNVDDCNEYSPDQELLQYANSNIKSKK
jgi:hypothetical protein